MTNTKIGLPAPTATVVDRVKYLIRLLNKTQASFGKIINVDPSNMSKFLTGRIPMTDGFINRIVVNIGVSKEWLINGIGVPFPKGSEMLTIQTGSQVAAKKKGAPVYNIDVTAGHAELSRMFTTDRIIGYLDMPNINHDNPVVRVSGDSMSPRIPNGCYISIRPIENTSIIFWGQVYLVVTDDYRMVKVIRRDHQNPDCVILHSYNDEYDDIEMPRNQIQSLYLVDAVLNYDILS